MNAIQMYIRKITSALEGEGGVRVSSFFDEHVASKPLLHPHADEKKPDISALIYSLLRLPPEIFEAESIVLGQSDRVFTRANLHLTESEWKSVSAPARKRKMKFHAKKKILAVSVGSQTDVLDLVTICTALSLEMAKLEQMQKEMNKTLPELFEEEDFQKLKEALGNSYGLFEKAMKDSFDPELRLLGGSLLDYGKATQDWWIHLASVRKHTSANMYERPIYFVSSNQHSLLNLLSGFPVSKEKFLLQKYKKVVDANREAFTKERVPTQNICYYLSRFAERDYPEYKKQKENTEKKHGLFTIPPFHNIDIEAQVFSLKDAVEQGTLDSRLTLPRSVKNALLKSDALILNIAYPLGQSAYSILREVSENASQVLGVYIMGKAASLNGGVGDVIIPSFVKDVHTGNEIFLQNCFDAGQVSPYFAHRSILTDQKALTVEGTFLQNNASLMESYHKGFTIIEMEAGPYLNRLYEMQYPARHPLNETFVIHPHFDFGLLYYVSDTPHKQGVNLGAKRLTWEGLNATYATSIAIVNRIFEQEYKRQKSL